MKVKTLITMWGANGPIKPGSIIDMNEAEARVNIARKFAESAEDEKPAEAPAPAPVKEAPAPIADPADLAGSDIQIPGVVGTFNAECAEDAQDDSEAGEATEEEEVDEKPAEAPVEAPKQATKQAQKANPKKR